VNQPAIQRLGSFLLCRDAEPPSPPPVHPVPLDLRPAAERLAIWERDGGLLALQAVSPLGGLEASVRARADLLAAGPGAALAALGGVALGLARVAVALHPDDREAFAAVREHIDSPTQLHLGARLEELPARPLYFRTLLGCGGRVPPLDDAAPLVRRLLPEGQFLLSGVPAADLETVFDEFSRNGLSLRACGFRAELAFLAGSLGHAQGFRA